MVGAPLNALSALRDEYRGRGDPRDSGFRNLPSGVWGQALLAGLLVLFYALHYSNPEPKYLKPTPSSLKPNSKIPGLNSNLIKLEGKASQKPEREEAPKL